MQDLQATQIVNELMAIKNALLDIATTLRDIQASQQGQQAMPPRQAR